MAYRQLLALACLTLGAAVFGCGSGGSARSAQPDDADQPPTNAADPSPGNSDQPRSSYDRPPYNPDQPGGAPAPGGGGGDEAAAEAACRALCDIVGTNEDQCPGGGANGAARSVCASGCTVTAELRPCLAKGVALVNCLSGLNGLCTEDGPSESDTARCNAALNELSQCSEQQNPPDPQPGGDDCSGSDCEKCICEAGTDLDKLQGCAARCQP